MTWLALLDAMIADTGKRWVPGIYGDSLVEASRALTALEDTSKPLDMECLRAVEQFMLNDANY